MSMLGEVWGARTRIAPPRPRKVRARVPPNKPPKGERKHVGKMKVAIITGSWYNRGFPGSSAGKESACNVGDHSLISGSGRSPGEGIGYPLQYTEQLHFHFSLSCIGEGNGNPLQCSCLENPRDGGA